MNDDPATVEEPMVETTIEVDEEDDDLEHMSISGMSERGQLMKKLEMHHEMQNQMQDEMDTASIISSKMLPPPPM